MDQEIMIQLQMIEQEVNQLNSQSQLVEQHVSEMQDLKLSLNEIEKSEDKNILVNIGKRIYIPVEIKDKELVVEVGNKTFVKKSIKDTTQTIDEQIEKLVLAKDQITERLQELDAQMDLLIQENSKKEDSKDECNCGHEHEKHGCDHENCECEEDCGDECKCKHN
jgi:prefoldin alpha subunit